MNEEGWLMRALLADPDYLEIAARVERDGFAETQVQMLPGNHDETNAKIRRLLGKPARDPVELQPLVEQIYKAAREIDDDADGSDGLLVAESLGGLLAEGFAPLPEQDDVEVHPDQHGLF